MVHEKIFNLMNGTISNTTMEKPADKRSEDMKNMSNNNNINHDHHHKVILKCPRCDSLNTKFCYYNNYSLSQPRHLCRDCKRYWTRGGILRNVPLGSATCKNKNNKKFLNKPPQTLSSSVQISDPNAAVLYGLPTNHVLTGFHTMGYDFHETLAGEGFQNQINPSISDLYWNNTTWFDHSSSSSSNVHDYYSAPSLI